MQAYFHVPYNNWLFILTNEAFSHLIKKYLEKQNNATRNSSSVSTLARGPEAG